MKTVTLCILLSLTQAGFAANDDSDWLSSYLSRLVQIDDLQQQLKLSENQIGQLDDLQRDRNKEEIEFFFSTGQIDWTKAEKATRKEQSQKRKAWEKTSNAIVTKSIKKVLTSKQLKQLTGLIVWEQLNYPGALALLSAEPIKTTLDIDDGQLAYAKQDAERLAIQFEKELSQLKKKYRARLSEKLTKEQRKKVGKIFGKKPKVLSQRSSREPRF